ncbi:hypothetical protein C8R44DRAFT_734799 [Mycena epipterygia]|nr:hypothetical protein C8R44DRAFT_734799 [Mycena epipterygia]
MYESSHPRVPTARAVGVHGKLPEEIWFSMVKVLDFGVSETGNAGDRVHSGIGETGRSSDQRLTGDRLHQRAEVGRGDGQICNPRPHVSAGTDRSALATILRTAWFITTQYGRGVVLEKVVGGVSAPSLVDVSILHGYRYVPTLLPSHQLTQYTLNAPWETHRGVLTEAPNLVQANIHVGFENEAGWPDPDEQFTFCISNETGFTVFQGDDLDLPHLEPFVARSRCTLQKISFNGTPMPQTATAILRQYPSVIELAVIVPLSQSANNLISHLTVPDSTGIAAVSPQLSQISFGSSDDRAIDYTLYLRMLQSRWKAADCDLKGAALLTRSGKGPDPVTLRDLDALRRDGMNILVMQGAEAGRRMNGWAYYPTWF